MDGDIALEDTAVQGGIAVEGLGGDFGCLVGMRFDIAHTVLPAGDNGTQLGRALLLIVGGGDGDGLHHVGTPI